MKKLLFFITCISIFAACSKDEQVILPGSDVQNVGLVCGKVFKVEPTKGGDITVSLKQAFNDAIAAGPGSVVQLPEGKFELDLIVIREFYGSFVGAGKGKTVITPKTGLDCTGFESQGLWTFLINFVGGDILMSNMTLKITDEAICAGGEAFSGLVIFADYINNYTSLNNSVKAIVNNVEFIGCLLGPWNYNCWNALAGGQNTKVTSGLNRSNIDMTITNCMFDTFGFGTQLIGAKNGKYTLGTKNNGNIFKNCYESSFFFDIMNMPVEVVDNKFNVPASYYGLEFNNSTDGRWVAEPQTKPIMFNVAGNQFNKTGAGPGLMIRDMHRIYYPGELPMLCQVRNNRFKMSNNASVSIGCFNMVGMVIRNNNFTGSGQFGVRIMSSGEFYNENGLLLGNNFDNLTCSAATVLLNTGSRNWTIIGGDLGEGTLDLGENNIITGFNVFDSEDPLGQTIKDNLEEWRDAMHGSDEN